MPQVATIGDVSDATFLANTAGTEGPAVYAFNCAGRIFNNAFANEPVNAVRVPKTSQLFRMYCRTRMLQFCSTDAACKRP